MANDQQILTALEIKALSTALPLWQVEPAGAWMKRDFLFKDFLAAYAFMSQVALIAHAHDHHPNWSNVYNKVSIQLFTHDRGALTLKDQRLALAIDGLLV
ncbi:MAG: 4a-hydroxytetrahydrobiopterin dehydratase [Betaproteobacteria bacterium]